VSVHSVFENIKLFCIFGDNFSIQKQLIQYVWVELKQFAMRTTFCPFWGWSY